MEALLQSQIKESCKLALPEGLRDLMCDISREVLRAQPSNIYHFISNYLSALLLTRETLTIASRICTDVCDCSCLPELDEELRNLGLEEDDVEAAKNVVMEYFDKDGVNEGNLLMKLLNKTTIDDELLPAVQVAVRRAFCRQHNDRINKELEHNNEAMKAAKRTLKVYEKSDLEKIHVDRMATKIQALYRGYSVRREIDKKVNTVASKENLFKMPHEFWHKTSVFSTLSATSLAGSYLSLPQYVPYSAHKIRTDKLQDIEPKYINVDHTKMYDAANMKKMCCEKDDKKKIVFHNVLDEIKLCADEHDDDVESCFEENIEENIQTEVSAIKIMGESNEFLKEYENDQFDQEVMEECQGEAHTSEEIIEKDEHETSFDKIGYKYESGTSIENMDKNYSRSEMTIEEAMEDFYETEIMEDIFETEIMEDIHETEIMEDIHESETIEGSNQSLIAEDVYETGITKEIHDTKPFIDE